MIAQVNKGRLFRSTMARRKTARNSSQPHDNKCLAVNLAVGDNYLDLAQLMSQANRKTFSSGAYYVLKSIQANTNSANMSIETTPSGWPVEKAYKHARKGWAKWRKAMGLKATRFARFRPFLEQAQMDGLGGFGNNLALAGTGFSGVAGEYDPSLVEYEDEALGTTHELRFKLTGNHGAGVFKTVGMVQELSQFRLKAQADIPASDADDQMIPRTLAYGAPPDTDAVEENLTPPYAAEVYPGEAGTVPIWNYTWAAGSNASQGINMHIPCGLLKITSDTALTNVCIKIGKIQRY